jgi:Protein of unknown function (DUF3592)
MSTRAERRAQFAPKIPGLLTLMGAALLVMGFALVVGASGEASETRLLDEEGVETTAQVVESHIVERVGQGPIEVSEKVSFVTEGGETVETTITDCGSREPEPTGSTVEVRYAPSDPESVQFSELACRKIDQAKGFVIAGVIALVLSVVAFYFAWRKRRALKVLAAQPS